MITSSSQNATFAHCINPWMPRPCVSAGRGVQESPLHARVAETLEALRVINEGLVASDHNAVHLGLTDLLEYRLSAERLA